MSTIASPRDSSANGRRIPQISTPTSSSRPSFETTTVPRSPSVSGSPVPQPKRANRAALREYYNLKKSQLEDIQTDDHATASSSSSIHDQSPSSPTLLSALDSPTFEAAPYISQVLATQSLSTLLQTYNSILTSIRSLDAEKKALVYDNYSKLIAATETIRKMRENMDPLNPMARTLDPAIAGVYERAEGIKREMRKELEKRGIDRKEDSKEKDRGKARAVAKKVLDTPAKMRALLEEGKEEEARKTWEPILRLLEKWKERGVGGNDVLDCIKDGEAALRGELLTEHSA